MAYKPARSLPATERNEIIWNDDEDNDKGDEAYILLNRRLHLLSNIGSRGTKKDGDLLTVNYNVDSVTDKLLDPESGRKSRPFSNILYMYSATTSGARKITVNYILFRRVLLPIKEVNKLVPRS